jgi:hypothetical protein
MSDFPSAETRDLPRFESMNVGMILDKAIHVYTKNFWLLIGIMAIPAALSLLLGRVFLSSGRLDSASGLLSLPLYIVLVIVADGIGGAAVTAVLSGLYLGRETSFAGAYAAALKKAGAITIAKLLSVLFCILGIFVIVPGIILALSYTLVSPVVMLESIPASRSLKRSRELMKGFRWKTFGMALIYLLISGLILLVGTMAARLLVLLTEIDAFQYMLPSLLTAALNLFIAPLPPIIATLIYYNQRIGKENFDLVLLAEAMTGK